MSLRKTSREIERIIVKIEEGMNGYREQQETCRDKENSRYDVAEGSVECSSGTVKRSSVAKTVLAEAMPNTKSWTTCQIRCLSGRYCVLSKTGEILGVNTSSALQTVADNAVSGKCRKRKISNINNSVINPSDSNSDALETADVPSPLPKPGERQSLQELGDMKELILNLSKKLTELDEKVTKSLQQTLKERNDAESELELPANIQLPLESIEAVERLEAQVEDNNVKNASGEENVCPTLNTVTHSVGRSISDKQKLQGHENVRIIGTAQTYQAAVSMRNAVAETSNIEADDDVSRRIKRPRLCVSADDLLTSESTLRQPTNSNVFSEETQCHQCRGFQVEVISLLHKILGSLGALQKSCGSFDQSAQEDLVYQAKSLADLEETLKRMETEPNYRQELVSYLANIGGRNTGDTVRNIMSRVGTPDVWKLFSFKGQRGKERFNTSPICEVIIKAAMKSGSKRSEKCTEQSVAVAIADVLRYAKKNSLKKVSV